MRFSAFLGSVLALGASMGVVNTHAQMGPSLMLPAILPERRTTNTSSRPSRIERHTGAGGPGMHRAWKRRRASGRV